MVTIKENNDYFNAINLECKLGAAPPNECKFYYLDLKNDYDVSNITFTSPEQYNILSDDHIFYMMLKEELLIELQQYFFDKMSLQASEDEFIDEPAWESNLQKNVDFQSRTTNYIGKILAGGATSVAFFYLQDQIRMNIRDKRLCSLIESVCFLFYDMSKCKRKVDIIIPLFRFARENYEGVFLQEFVVNVQNCINTLFSMELQGNDESFFFDKLRSYFEDFDTFKTSPLFTKVYKLAMYILSFVLFEDKDCKYESFGYTAMEAAAFRSKYHMGKDFVYVLLDTVTFLCQKGHQIYRDGYSSSIFHSSDRYKDFHKRCEKIFERSEFIKQDEALDENEFLVELDELIEKGSDILKCSKFLNKFDISFVQKYYLRLKSIKLDILTFKGATKARKTPFGALIFGNSGIGKTSLMRILIHQFCAINDLRDADEFIYFRNFTEEFWNNFRTCMHTVILDDISNEHPALKDPKSVNEIIAIMNDANYVPNQASLEDKGRIPLRCKFVVATTNVKNLQATAYFSCPSAVQRRFPYVITPTVKPMYQNPISGMLDPTLVPKVEDDSYDDLWYFKVEKVKTTPIDPTKSIQAPASFEIVHDGIEMPEFISWFTEAVKDFNTNQDIVTNAVTGIRKTKSCYGCKLPLNYCNCELQSASFDLLYFGWMYGWFTICQEIIYSMILLILPYFGLLGWNISAINYILSRPVLATKLFSNMGHRVCNNYGTPKNLCKIAAFVTTLYGAYKLYNLTKRGMQGANQSKQEEVGKRPHPTKDDDKEQVWYNNDYELSTFDVTRTTLSSKGLSIVQVKNIIFRNCVSMKIQTGHNSIKPVKAFCIGGQVYIMNNHCLPKDDHLNIELIHQSSKEGVNSNVFFRLSQKDVMRFPDNDLACFIVRCLPPKKDLTEFFCLPSFRANTHGVYVGKNKDGSLFERIAVNVKFVESDYTVPLFSYLGYVPVMNKWFAQSNEVTQKGDCGSLLLVKSELGFCIVGMHMQGDGCKAASVALDSTIIASCKKFGNKFFISANPPMLQSESENPVLGDLHPKSCFRYVPKGNANVYGSFMGFRSTHKSRVEPTLMNEVVKQYDYEEKFGRPVFDWRPWNLSVNDSANIPNTLDTEILDKCADSFLTDILERIDISLIKEEVHIYDTFTAINGAAGVNHIDKINRNTSAGFPHHKSKKYFINKIDPIHDMQDPVDITDEIKNLVSEITDRYLHGETASPVFTAHLKDEPLSFKKINLGKTRVFSGANFPWTIVVRKYLLSIIRLIQSNHEIFEAAPGINAHSKDWNKLYNYLIFHGKERIVAGDYGKYDKRMGAALILSAFRIIIQICEKSGNYSQQSLDVIKGIGYDTSFAFTSFNGDLVQFFGSNPSGHPLTVIINCLVNSLYMRYSYYMCNPNNECETFKENVNLMTYGDDNAMGISSEVPWFNHTSISDVLADIGVVYTMPDKEAESKPYMHIEECSFLKRYFRFDKNLECVVGPLDEGSIERSLLTWVRSKSITPEEQAIAVITSANREYFFYGEEIYRKKQKMFWDIIHKCNLNLYVVDSTLPTYGSLIEDFNGRE